ncbi:hypothetical protein B0H11DRAFT_2280541 [Mycena galericulata]|nr:hypothetical protein B0H11DRAFT_2095021 [Mycena galericulata]KAJ7480485.1 hypothetical protein B0H11DRAFT_2280525 [Mycena galericulata]KAJ7480532.1 hypothetical protein B0H11DRAFT_2280541 [Mycena galericulata]
MASLRRNGIIHGVSQPDNPDYQSCCASFFPSPSYHGVASHEQENANYYYLVFNEEQVRVYSDRAGCDAGMEIVKDASESAHRCLLDAAHAIYDWCKHHHNHRLPERRSPRSLNTFTDRAPVTLSNYQAPRGRVSHVSRSVRPASACQTPSRRSPNTSGHLSPSASRDSSADPPRVSLPDPLLPSGPLTTELVANADTTKGWFITSAGEIFQDATEAEAAVKDSDLKLKIVRDLQAGRAWYLSL